ncbi:MAG: hypothetical protein WCG94_09120 [Methanothrix sp.]
MGKGERFIQTEIDRTPYHACGLVLGACLLTLLLVGGLGWKFSVLSRKSGWFDWLGANQLTPSLNLSPSDLINQAKGLNPADSASQLLQDGQATLQSEAQKAATDQANRLQQSLQSSAEAALESAAAGVNPLATPSAN